MIKFLDILRNFDIIWITIFQTVSLPSNNGDYNYNNMDGVNLKVSSYRQSRMCSQDSPFFAELAILFEISITRRSGAG